MIYAENVIGAFRSHNGAVQLVKRCLSCFGPKGPLQTSARLLASREREFKLPPREVISTRRGGRSGVRHRLVAHSTPIAQRSPKTEGRFGRMKLM